MAAPLRLGENRRLNEAPISRQGAKAPKEEFLLWGHLILKDDKADIKHSAFYMLGKTIGNYRITGELAQGGMGSVYRGHHQSLPREVVVKCILFSSFPPQAQEQLKARFVREAYIQAQLDHQNVVRVYEFFTTAENYYLVMEFISQDIELQLTPTNEFLPPPIAEYNFHTGLAGVDYGFIVTIGDVPLEKVTLEHDRVKFLATYNPPLTLPEARAEQRRALDGTRWKGWYGYKQYAPVNVNYTYALRSIHFDRSDVLVAFRVVRKEIDGSVVILWKTLKQFSAPTLVR
jgi:hypothetical protein